MLFGDFIVTEVYLCFLFKTQKWHWYRDEKSLTNTIWCRTFNLSYYKSFHQYFYMVQWVVYIITVVFCA